MSYIFVSYSHKDKAYVQKLHNALQSEGFDVWIDDRIDYGTTWPTVIQRNLDSCSAFVIVMTENAYESKWVHNEVTRAERKKKPIFILLLSGETWLSFEAIQYEDVSGERLPSEKFYESLARVAPRKKNGVPVASQFLSGKSRLTHKPNMAIGFTLMGFAGMIIAAVLGFPLIEKRFSPTLTPTSLPTVTITIEVPTDTPIPTPTVISWQQGKIAYVARNAGKVYFLYIQDLSKERQSQLLLAPDKPTQSRYYAPWFAPDGQLLAFDDRYSGKIFVMDIDDVNSPRSVGLCYSPSFSPDGTRVVCDANGADYFLIYNTETGTKISTIYLGKGGAVLPAWSPDGKEIAFSILEGNGKASVWKVGIDGSSPIPLATNASEDYAPSWSPDGEWIAFQSTLTSDKSEVWIMRLDGSGRKQITFSSGGEIWSRGPCFSPDGNWLAFVSNQNGTDGPDFGDVFVISLLTGELRQITDTGGYVLDWRVTWSK